MNGILGLMRSVLCIHLRGDVLLYLKVGEDERGLKLDNLPASHASNFHGTASGSRPSQGLLQADEEQNQVL